MFIYKITNTITNKIYVGQTKRPIEKRLQSHLYEAKVHKDDMYLHKSMRKYGFEAFKVELLEECDIKTIYEREKYWIKSLNSKSPNGYNQHDGGNGGCLNPSSELRQKLKDAKKNFIPWNKGLDKSDPRVAALGKQISKKSKGVAKSTQHKLAMQRTIKITNVCQHCKKFHNNKIFCSNFCRSLAKAWGGWNKGLTKKDHPKLTGGKKKNGPVILQGGIHTPNDNS